MVKNKIHPGPSPDDPARRTSKKYNSELDQVRRTSKKLNSEAVKNKVDPQDDENQPTFKSCMQRASFLSYLHFMFAFKIMKLANKKGKKGKVLQTSDLPGLAWKERAHLLEEEFLKHLKEQVNQGKKLSLGWAIIKTYKKFLLMVIFLQTLLILLKIISVLVMKNLLDSLGDETAPITEGFQWAGVLCGMMLFTMYFEHHYFYFSTLVPVHIRSGIVSMIFSKVTRVPLYFLHKMSVGKIVNIVANDVGVFDRTGNFFTSLVTGPIALVAAGGMLWYFYGPVCLVGIGFVAIGFPLQNYLAGLAAKPREQKNTATDLRVRLTDEVIEGIRLLKMYTWELIFGNNINELRKAEIKLLKKIMAYEGLSRGIAFSTQPIAALLIFIVYTLTGNQVNVAIVFPTTFLISTLKSQAIISFANAVSFLVEAKLLFERVIQIMEAPESSERQVVEPQDPNHAIEFEGFSASWTVASDEPPQTALSQYAITVNEQLNSATNYYDEKNALHDINLCIQKGTLNAVVGRIGCGKTSFLLSITGELPQTFGQLRHTGTIAYVEQEPTIFSGTIRENILFGRPYRPDFYHKVIEACCLESDLKLFANGDKSEIGEKGVNMSGGQRARLALARAVYSDADIYLLDDPLSAVDAKVARKLYQNAIQAMLKGKTVILATHQIHLVKNLKNIIVIDQGKMLGYGKYEDLRTKGMEIARLFSTFQRTMSFISAPSLEEGTESFSGGLTPFHASEMDFEEEEEGDIKPEGDKGKLFTDEDPYGDTVTYKTYLNYLLKMGSKLVLALAFVIFLGNEIANICFSRFLGFWANQEINEDTSMIIMSLTTIVIIILYIVKAILFNTMLLKASNKIHNQMTDQIIKAPVSFFDTNPVGRILNRFSNDIGVADRSMSQYALDVVETFFAVASQVITVAVVSPLTLIPAAIASVAIVMALRFSYHSISQTRSQDLISRSPLYSLFSSTLSGLLVIRTYSQEHAFKQKFRAALYDNTKANVAFRMCSRFFGFYVDYIYNISAICSVLIITGLKSNSALSGLSLSYILGIASVLQVGLRQSVQMNVLMASISRIQSYCDLPTEAPLTLPGDSKHKKVHWPQEGKIAFSDVYMKYRENMDHIVKGLSFEVKPGEKIGCVGRTGAGKSTIVQILFRMIEIDRKDKDPNNSFVKIDGIDTERVGLHLLRNNISIIPQIPYVFSGTIKNNLDPLGKHTDDELWKVLTDVNLKEFVERCDKQLDTEMTGSSLFSVGQKQLVCLARAILKKSKIIVLDEATANVDMQTDNFIQMKINEKFKDCTVFTIAHRLSTIANYDKVLVLDQGKLVEFDTPFNLLVNDTSDAAVTKTDGHFASMVINTGPRTTKQIFQIARNSFIRRARERPTQSNHMINNL